MLKIYAAANKRDLVAYYKGVVKFNIEALNSTLLKLTLKAKYMLVALCNLVLIKLLKSLSLYINRLNNCFATAN